MGWSQAMELPHPKIAKREGCLLAGTGDCYLINLIVHYMHLPKQSATIDFYMYNQMRNQIYRFLKNNGYVDNGDGLMIPDDGSAEILIAKQGRLFSYNIASSEVGNRMVGQINICEVSLPYAAGCGGLIALGSLLTTEGTQLTPEERLSVAVGIAGRVSPGCDENVDIVKE